MECQRSTQLGANQNSIEEDVVEWRKHLNLYFPDLEVAEKDRRAILVTQLLPYFTSPEGVQTIASSAKLDCGNLYVILDFDSLCTSSDSPDLLAAIEIQPEEGLKCISLAVHAACLHHASVNSSPCHSIANFKGSVVVRLHSFAQSAASIGDLKSSNIGRLVTLRGTVVRCGSVKPLVESVSFACPKCASTQKLELQNGEFQVPFSCELGCKAKTFEVQRSSAALVDSQKIRIREQNTARLAEEGKAPRTIEIELTHELTGVSSAGDEVEVVGIVKVTSSEIKKGSKQEKCFYLLYLQAVSVRKLASKKDHDAETRHNKTSEKHDKQEEGSSLTQREMRAIQAFSKEFCGHQLKQLVHSFCPSIFGNRFVKAGLLLAILGGTDRHEGSGSEMRIRSNIHVLLCGDPGLGKSQLLQAAAAVAPRGVYICGTTSSSAGLTASVIRDSLSGEYMCEAGALVLADQGACCIDEFDKLTAEHQAILGAMEQQEVTVAKAGICATLPARTTVLAAANPAGGNFDWTKTVAENVKMSSAMISRFDLAFLLSDKPDSSWDQRLSEHVLAKHSGKQRHECKRQRLTQSTAPKRLPSQNKMDSLCDHWLDMNPEQDVKPLPARFIQKYISFARANVQPKLSLEAKQVLKEFYIQMRQSCELDGQVVTIRQLESLIRLTEARARADLRCEASAQDAQEVISLMAYTLHSNAPAASQAVQSKRRGKQAEADRLVNGLLNWCRREECSEFSSLQIFSLADQLEINVPDLDSLIEELNEAGMLFRFLHLASCTKFGKSLSWQPRSLGGRAGRVWLSDKLALDLLVYQVSAILPSSESAVLCL